MIQELVIALMLGLIGGVIPGPVITAVFTEILQSGYLRSLRIILIALVTETMVALLSLIILDSLNFNEAFFRGLSLGGAAILIWIALSLWKVRSLDSDRKGALRTLEGGPYDPFQRGTMDLLDHHLHSQSHTSRENSWIWVSICLWDWSSWAG